MLYAEAQCRSPMPKTEVHFGEDLSAPIPDAETRRAVLVEVVNIERCGSNTRTVEAQSLVYHMTSFLQVQQAQILSAIKTTRRKGVAP